MTDSSAFTPSNYIGTRNTFDTALKKLLMKRRKPITLGVDGKKAFGGAGKYFNMPASLAGEDVNSK